MDSIRCTPRWLTLHSRAPLGTPWQVALGLQVDFQRPNPAPTAEAADAAPVPAKARAAPGPGEEEDDEDVDAEDEVDEEGEEEGPAAPVEGMLARRRRLEKERGQPAYFKYKITGEKYVNPVQRFLERGKPEEIRIRIRIANRGQGVMTCSTGLQTHFAVPDASSPYVRTLGLGLLQFLDMRNPAQPDVAFDEDHSVEFAKEPLDRWYPDTQAPNELFFTSGRRCPPACFCFATGEGQRELRRGA